MIAQIRIDCPYLITVVPMADNSLWTASAFTKFTGHMITVRYHLKWLEEQNITRYNWEWRGMESSGYPFHSPRDRTGGERQYLTFKFENENDRLLFALRWA